MRLIVYLIFSLISILIILACEKIIMKKTWKEVLDDWSVYLMLLILGPVGTGLVVLGAVCAAILAYMRYKK